MSEAKKTLYIAKGMDIKHGGVLYPEGELLELDDSEAQALHRWIEPAKPVKATSANVDETANPKSDAPKQKDDPQ